MNDICHIAEFAYLTPAASMMPICLQLAMGLS